MFTVAGTVLWIILDLGMFLMTTPPPDLAPTKDMLEIYKKKKSNWQVYECQFLELMRSRRVEERFPREMLDGECLLCSEEKPIHCHRRLVAEYLKAHWSDVDIEHIP